MSERQLEDPRSIEDRQDRIQEIDRRIAELTAEYKDRKFPEERREEWNTLNSERDEHNYEIQQITARKERLREVMKNPNATERATAVGPSVTPKRSNPWQERSKPLGDRARDAVEQMHTDGVIGDGGAELAERLVRGDNPRNEVTRAWMLATSDPAYERAFFKVLADPVGGHRTFTALESETYTRAMSLSPDSAGGHLTVPFQLDPTIVLSSAGSIDPFREICRRETITQTDVWKGVSSAGVTANWFAEAAEVTDDSATVADVQIPTHRASAYVPFSIELDQDSAQIRTELAKLFADAKVQLEATAFTSGTGTGEPTGIVPALGAAETVTTGITTYVADDSYALVEAVPARFRSSMRVLSSLPIVNVTRRFTSTDEPAIVNDDLSRWLGKPLHETSTLDDSAATTGNTIALAGDFSHAVIVDRVGMTVELNPVVVGANNRPTGERGLFAFWRVGHDVLVPNAIRKLVIG